MPDTPKPPPDPAPPPPNPTPAPEPGPAREAAPQDAMDKLKSAPRIHIIGPGEIVIDGRSG